MKRTPEDFDEIFLELVAEFMEAGMNQDDAEIKAAEEIEERKEMALMDAADAAHERSEEDL